ncbi:hypothetical protein ACS3UN_13385 [Oscillospiraceae bacterium LTW-04]|nr:hypothetical protein RBH76_01195 [Oscillospiraceae bacterium MB24-C1]
MNQKLLLLPKLTLIAGVFLAGLDYIYLRVVVFMNRPLGSLSLAQVERMNAVYSVLIWIISITAIVIIGMKAQKQLSRAQIIKSSMLLCGYYVTFLIFQNVLQTQGVYNLGLHALLVLPVSVFSFASEIMLMIFKTFSWLYVIPAVIMPLVFILFAKPDHPAP